MNKPREPGDETLEDLRLQLLEFGAKLPSLEGPQKSRGNRNNNVEGKDYLQPIIHEGNTMSDENLQESKGKSKSGSEGPPAAGGRNDAEAAQTFMRLMGKASDALDYEKNHKRTYSQKALDATITSAAVIVTGVVVYAGITFVSRQWGTGRLLSERNELLIEQNKLLREGGLDSMNQLSAAQSMM